MYKIPKNINEVINEFTIKVKKLLGNRVKKIILYGSYARGDFNKNSDIDIMILVKSDSSEIKDIERKILDYSYELDLKYDILLCSTKFYKKGSL